MQSPPSVERVQYPVLKVLLAGVIAILLSIVANLGLRQLGMLIVDVPADFVPLASVQPIIIFTALFIAVATLVWFIITRVSTAPLKTWNWAVLIGFVISVIPDLLMPGMDQPIPNMGTFTWGATAILLAMHAVSGFITWRALPRFSAPESAMSATPPSEATPTIVAPAAKTLLSGIAFGFLLAILVGGALYWWANRPVPATLTLEPPAPVATQAIPQPVLAPLPADQPSRSTAIQAVGGERINLNTATLAELDTLPGIGPAKALAIIAGRPYASIDALDAVPGIGPATIEELRALVSTE